MITEDEFLAWFRYAKPGQWTTYHRGQHLYGLSGTKRTAATLVMELAENGELFIAQRRVADTSEFEYRAMKLDEKLQKRLKSWSR